MHVLVLVWEELTFFLFNRFVDVFRILAIENKKLKIHFKNSIHTHRSGKIWKLFVHVMAVLGDKKKEWIETTKTDVDAVAKGNIKDDD